MDDNKELIETNELDEIQVNNENNINIKEKNKEDNEQLEDNLIVKMFNKIKDTSSKLDGNQNFIDKIRFSKKVIGIYGLCGGCGTSSFINELAIKLASEQFNVLIIDGNYLFPYHIIHYIDNVKELKKSLLDVLEEPIANIYNIIEKSSISKNINYCYQNNCSLNNLIKLEENFENFENIQKRIEEYKKIYDVILIDLCPNLLGTAIEQALVKSTQLFVQINTEDVNSKLNSLVIPNMLNLTSNDNTTTLSVFNKITNKNTKEKLWLPFEPHFQDNYNNAQSFLIEGKSDNDTYIKNFQIIYSMIYKHLI